MSVSPPKDGEGAGDASPENSEHMERGEEAQAREAYDFDVKEQDRWLPIANGKSSLLSYFFHFRLPNADAMGPIVDEKGLEAVVNPILRGYCICDRCKMMLVRDMNGVACENSRGPSMRNIHWLPFSTV